MNRSRVAAWGYLLALLVVVAAVAQAPEPAAPASKLKLAYVYKGNKGSADGFKTLLDGAGLPTDLVKVDAVEKTLKDQKVRPAHIEGYERAEWILLDYFDFVVHVFSTQARQFYGLERLWGEAVRIEVADDAGAAAQTSH